MEHLPATFALKRMLTRYNFGAARDPEMLHKIYNAEPVAPIIEIPRRDIYCIKYLLASWGLKQAYILLLVKLLRARVLN